MEEIKLQKEKEFESRPLWHLTIGEFKELLVSAMDEAGERTVTLEGGATALPPLTYGTRGISKLLGISQQRARHLLRVGVFDKAINQVGRSVVADTHKVIRLFGLFGERIRPYQQHMILEEEDLKRFAKEVNDLL